MIAETFRWTGMLSVPGVNLGLQVIAFLEQGPVDRQQLADEVGEPVPERFRGDTGPGQHLLAHEVVQQGSDAQRADFQRGRWIHGLLEAAESMVRSYRWHGIISVVKLTK